MLKELSIKMSDGFSVYAFIKQPTGDPVAHIHLMHGMAEHIGRYEEFAKHLVEQGYIVSGHDHRGHGKTVVLNGIQGHFADEGGFERAVQDAYETITFLKTDNPSPRFILFGHSMGSFIARRYVQLHGGEVDQAIYSGTSGDPGIGRFAGQAVAYLSGKKYGFNKPNPILNKLVFGGFNKSIKNSVTEFDWLSSDRNSVEKYIADPACGFVPTSRFFEDLFYGLGKIHSNKELNKTPKNMPIFLFSGSKDPVGGNGKGVWSVAKQYKNAGMNDVTVLLFEGGRHEMLHEVNREEVFKTIIDWIEKR